MRNMLLREIHSDLCCPHCGRRLRESADRLHCDNCEQGFPIRFGIPVFTLDPTERTDTLSSEEVELLLRRIDRHGWQEGLCRGLLEVADADSEQTFAELSDERGVLGAMLAGGSQDQDVLLLGCSACAIPFALARHFDQVTVCDRSLSRLRLMQARAGNEDYRNLRFIAIGSAPRCPLPAARFDLVLLDIGSFAAEDLKLTALCREAARLLKPSGKCMAMSRQDSKRKLKRLGVVGRHSRGQSPRRLQRAMQPAGLRCVAKYGMLPCYRSPSIVFDLAAKSVHGKYTSYPNRRMRLKSLLLHNDRLIESFGLVFGKPGHGPDSQCIGRHGGYVGEILSRVQRQLNSSWEPNSPHHVVRMFARRSGRMVFIIATGEAGNEHVVVKAPFRESALEADHKNTAALQAIHRSRSIPSEVKRLIPRHRFFGEGDGMPYFVEDAILDLGSPTAKVANWPRPVGKRPHCRKRDATSQFADVVLQLQKATRSVVLMSESELQPTRSALSAMRAYADTRRFASVWAKIDNYLSSELLGKRLPLVWSHGDAGRGNLILSRKGELLGIIDWESFDQNGLPLYDWIVTRMSVLRKNPTAGWNRIGQLLSGEEAAFFEGMPLEKYLESLEIDRRFVPALGVSAWARYIGHRLPNRGHDSDWTRRTIHEVLQVLQAVL